MNINRKLLNELEAVSGEAFTLSNLLRSIREGENLSQVEFSKKLSVSKQFICDLEHNRRSVSPKMAENFALKLGYSPKQFVRLCLQEMIKNQDLDYEVQLFIPLSLNQGSVVSRSH